MIHEIGGSMAKKDDRKYDMESVLPGFIAPRPKVNGRNTNFTLASLSIKGRLIVPARFFKHFKIKPLPVLYGVMYSPKEKELAIVLLEDEREACRYENSYNKIYWYLRRTGYFQIEKDLKQCGVELFQKKALVNLEFNILPNGAKVITVKLEGVVREVKKKK
jgi:hypothetical protein